MWAGNRADDLAVAAEVAGAREAQRAPLDRLSETRGLHVAGGQFALRAAPVRVEIPPLPPGTTSAEAAFDVVLRAYAPAIADNLRCVLTSADPEGPHQLRVTLRRLRTVLRLFRPVIRRTLHQRLAWVARYLGAIVGELRDADVMIEELIRPAALPEEAGVLAALEAWREDVRARVRASLLAARATAFANDLLQLSDTGGWKRGRSKRRKPSRLPAHALVDATLAAGWAHAAGRGARLAQLSAVERHDLRKDVKALRYSTEMAVAAGAQPDDVHLVATLRRVQETLGQLNDLDTLQRFDPPLASERDGLAKLRQRLIDAQSVPDLIAAAAARWRALAAAKRFALSAAPGL